MSQAFSHVRAARGCVASSPLAISFTRDIRAPRLIVLACGRSSQQTPQKGRRCDSRCPCSLAVAALLHAGFKLPDPFIKFISKEINPEAEALLRWKSSLIRANSLSSWSISSPTCSWFGITCDTAGHVTKLQLHSAGLHGLEPTKEVAVIQNVKHGNTSDFQELEEEGRVEVAAVSGCPGGLHRLLRPDSAGPILSVLHRFTLLHVHLGGGDDDPTCLVAQHCLPAPVLRQPHSPLCGLDRTEDD